MMSRMTILCSLVLAAWFPLAAGTTAWAGSPKNPCAANPCAAQNPCSARVNPCAANPCAAKNPCGGNPCAAKNPCAANPCAAKNPCAANPCAANPCAGGGAAKTLSAQTVWGQVVSAKPGHLTIRSASGKSVYVSLDRRTEIKLATAGLPKATVNDLAPGDRVAVSYLSGGATPRAAYVYLAKATGGNPCNPCAARNPCGGNPCAAQNPCGANPCGVNPCAAKNPCGVNPCAANPCAANPCGG